MSRLLIVFVALIFQPLIALGQEAQLTFVFPAGAQPGETVEADLNGKGIEAIDQLFIDSIELKVERVGKARIKVTVPPSAAVGEYDLWPVTKTGLGTPCRFVVGSVANHVEQEPNSTAETAEAITLPALIHGQIAPAVDADWYRVQLDAGQGLTIAARSVSLGGTVWPTITVYDPQGAEVAHDALNRLEPIVHVVATKAGEYRVAVQDRSYRSTTVPFYQVMLTTGPWLSEAFPLSLERGKSQPVSLYGYQLPGGKLVPGRRDRLQEIVTDVIAPSSTLLVGQRWLAARSFRTECFDFRQASYAGSIRFELCDRAPQRDLIDGDQLPLLLTTPVEIVNRFTTTRQSAHTYRFAAKKSQMFWLEAISERLDRPTDLELVICDASMKQLDSIGGVVVGKDDAIPLPIESRDPAGSWRAPEDGEYRLVVRELLSVTDDPIDRAYRVSIGPRLERMDVMAMLGDAAKPTAWSVAPGKSITVPLVAIRTGGHGEPIEVRGEKLPPGLEIKPVKLAGKERTGKLIITAAKDAQPWIGSIQLVATSKVEGKPQERPVRVALPIGGTTPGARICEAAVIAIR
jgi:hypothetical protein